MPIASSMTKRDQGYCPRQQRKQNPYAWCAWMLLLAVFRTKMHCLLGVDSPLYFWVHSAYGKLAPEGGALIHVAKYLDTSIEPKPREDESELEELLDLMQPGWRQVVVKKRPLPSMVVSNAAATAATGGLAGRPDARIANNLYIVGDWVGKEGLLSNGSVASAKHAAQLI